MLAGVLRRMPVRIPAWRARRPLYGALDNAHHLRRRPLAVSLIRQTSPKQYSRLAPRFAAPVASPAPIAGPGCEWSTSLLRLRAQLRHAHQPGMSLSIQRRADSCRLPPAEESWWPWAPQQLQFHLQPGFRPRLDRGIHLRAARAGHLPAEGALDRARILHVEDGWSSWDAMIVAACLECGVTRLYSEDLPGRVVRWPLEIVNPFRESG